MKIEVEMSMSKPIKIDIWSDVACPWCYIGKRRLENAVSQFAGSDGAPPIEIAYHSFQLDPSTPVDYAGTHAEYLAGHLGAAPADVARMTAQVTKVAAGEGLDYHLDDVKTANTGKAHELIHFAAANGKGPEMKERLLRAYFTEGKNVGKLDALADMAADVGLDRAAAKKALESGVFAKAVQADIAQAAGIGVRGVPFFVVDGKYGVSGAQETGVFLKALQQIAGERKADAA